MPWERWTLTAPAGSFGGSRRFARRKYSKNGPFEWSALPLWLLSSPQMLRSRIEALFSWACLFLSLINLLWIAPVLLFL